MKPIAVVAIGGNSLKRAKETGKFEQQQAHAAETCRGIAAILRQGYRVVLTHGNGPQVGEALLRSELAQDVLPTHNLDVCDAETEGSIGYLLQQTLDNVLQESGMPQKVVSIITQVLVDPNDPAFLRPDKPIGPFYEKEEAQQREERLGWKMIEDSGRGWRRVVASPHPQRIYELEAISACLDAGFVVIAAGGGGIPVVKREGHLKGSDAVIDKDRCSALLAIELGAELLVFSTGVTHVYLHFGKDNEKPLFRLSWDEARTYLRQGEFAAGSMRPKVEAALRFLDRGGRRAIITAPEFMASAVAGGAGTEIQPPMPVENEKVPV
ncbi:MAG TPA: carbamate kinase [Verrucomicrobiae bacterium]|nr:carbamate kinase [Verrucomicrobiae bacterium]